MFYPFLYIMVFFIITTSILCIWILSNKMSYFSKIKEFKGNLAFVFSRSFFECSNKMFFLCIWFMVGIIAWIILFVLCWIGSFVQATSLFDGFYFFFLISYVMGITCNSSILNESRCFISSMVATLASNIKVSDLKTFVKSSVPQPFHQVLWWVWQFSLSFIFRLWKCLPWVWRFTFLTLSFPVSSLSFFHFLNMNSYTKMICLYPLILENVEATIFVRNMHIIKNKLSINVTGPFFYSFYEYLYHNSQNYKNYR